VGVFFIFSRQHHWRSASVLSHLGTADFALYSRHCLWGTRRRRSAEAGRKMVGKVLSVIAWFQQLSAGSNRGVNHDSQFCISNIRWKVVADPTKPIHTPTWGLWHFCCAVRRPRIVHPKFRRNHSASQIDCIQMEDGSWRRRDSHRLRKEVLWDGKIWWEEEIWPAYASADRPRRATVERPEKSRRE
jgi:hypothetical protein